MRKLNRRGMPDECRPAALAQRLGQELGVPLGSAYYPGLALSIRHAMARGESYQDIEAGLRVNLGLEGKPSA